MINKCLFSSDSNEWATPLSLFAELDEEFGFTLDPCATDQNHKCERYFTKDDDGLSMSWVGSTVFCNPPYGRELPKWVEKAYTEHYKHNITVVMLIPARTDTQYFHRYIYHIADEVRFIKGRLHFNESKNPAPFPSMIVIWRSVCR